MGCGETDRRTQDHVGQERGTGVVTQTLSGSPRFRMQIRGSLMGESIRCSVTPQYKCTYATVPAARKQGNHENTWYRDKQYSKKMIKCTGSNMKSEQTATGTA